MIGFCGLGMGLPLVLGRFIFTPPIIKGAVTMKIINRTSITSIKGVTLMSEMAPTSSVPWISSFVCSINKRP
jgi:hypothetical protein